MKTETFIFETAAAEETKRLGASLGVSLSADTRGEGAVITLAGDLGAGKTTFVQGLGRGLGVQGAITSPTFVLINRYRTADGRRLQHADCYRLADAPLEMWDAGLADLFMSDDIVVVEWADRIPSLLPSEYLEIAIEHGEADVRRLTVSGHGQRYVDLLDQVRKRLREQVQ